MTAAKLDLDALQSWALLYLPPEKTRAVVHLIATARRLEEANAVVRALGTWAQRQQAGEVCWPQPMHDGTLRIYASKCAGTTPDVAQGADFLETAKSLCERLGIGWDPKAKDGG